MDSEFPKLHLGCLDVLLQGWINTDITPHIFVARVPGLAFLLYKLKRLPKKRYEQHRQGIYRQIRYLDVTRRFPFADASISCVFSSHMLEHLYPPQAAFCVAEMYRVLKKGGIARIAVPDLDRIIDCYNPSQPESFLDSLFEARQKNDKNRHHWHYNQTSISRLLREAGFQIFYRCEYRSGNCPDVQIIDNRPESLFMEAEK